MDQTLRTVWRWVPLKAVLDVLIMAFCLTYSGVIGILFKISPGLAEYVAGSCGLFVFVEVLEPLRVGGRDGLSVTRVHSLGARHVCFAWSGGVCPCFGWEGGEEIFFGFAERGPVLVGGRTAVFA